MQKYFNDSFKLLSLSHSLYNLFILIQPSHTFKNFLSAPFSMSLIFWENHFIKKDNFSVKCGKHIISGINGVKIGCKISFHFSPENIYRILWHDVIYIDGISLSWDIMLPRVFSLLDCIYLTVCWYCCMIMILIK